MTGVSLTSNGQVILSSSLDGTVRAFDLNRFVGLNLPIYTGTCCSLGLRLYNNMDFIAVIGLHIC